MIGVVFRVSIKDLLSVPSSKQVIDFCCFLFFAFLYKYVRVRTSTRSSIGVRRSTSTYSKYEYISTYVP